MTATPESGWRFEGWRGHCDNSGYVVIDNEYHIGQCRAVFVQMTASTSPNTSSQALPNDNTSETATTNNSDKDSPSQTGAKLVLPNQTIPIADLVTQPIQINTEQGQVTTKPLGLPCSDRDARPCVETKVEMTATPKQGFALIGWTCDVAQKQTITVSAETAQNCQPQFGADDDNDGIANVVEDAGPNAGDADHDGIPDSQQTSQTAPTGDNTTEPDLTNVTPPAQNPSSSQSVSSQDQGSTTVTPRPGSGASSSFQQGGSATHPDSVSTGNQPSSSSQPISSQEEMDVTGANAASETRPSSSSQSVEEKSERKSLVVTLKEHETLKMTLGEGQGVLFIKAIPDPALVLVDAWKPFGNGEGELILTGRQVGETEMIVNDSRSSQQVTLYIKVIANDSVSEVKPVEPITSDAETGTLNQILKVGQSVALTPEQWNRDRFH
ncbi:hypothetical protein BGS_0065 [Beggiatoa sp. SS]|nr:hypothetical protein BGS_0065 [Beggiatoa sp. SS]